jgi:hypothetical protein
MDLKVLQQAVLTGGGWKWLRITTHMDKLKMVFKNPTENIPTDNEHS